MRIEYTTRCSDGSVSITLTVEPGSAAKVIQSKKPDAPAPKPPVALKNSLSESKSAKDRGEGDMDPTETGSGGQSPVVIVFGPMVLGCAKGQDGGGGEVGPTGPDD